MSAGERILILDEDPATRRAMCFVLSSAGYAPIDARDAYTALELAETEHFELVVLDMMMHGRAGVEVCEKLRSSSRHHDVPVLFVSASGEGQAHRAAIDAGGDDFLTKPIHRGELLLRVRSLLQFRRMQRELAKSNELLTEQRDRLLKLQRQKDELTEIIVHDLKNPLAAIGSNANFLATATPLDDDARDCAAAISRASDNMLRMVHNILDISRAEDAKLVLHRERTDVAALLSRTRVLMARRAEDKRVAVELLAPTHGVFYDCDVDVLRRVLENLLDNALRYTPSRSAVELSLSLAEDGELRLAVGDGGPGIPEAERTRIFEKYAQLDRAADRAQNRFGRGIGLTFVKMAVEAHGGTIWVEGREPRGASFQIRLPPVSRSSRAPSAGA